MIIIDATNLVLGRLATYAAKEAMKGKEIRIINSEKAVVSGKESEILAKYKRKREFGAPLVGPFLPRMPDRFVRRTIRGMLPYKQEKGENAFKRVLCYTGVPEEFKDKEAMKVKGADADKLHNTDHVSVERISRFMGAKI